MLKQLQQQNMEELIYAWKGNHHRLLNQRLFFRGPQSWYLEQLHCLKMRWQLKQQTPRQTRCFTSSKKPNPVLIQTPLPTVLYTHTNTCCLSVAEVKHMNVNIWLDTHIRTVGLLKALQTLVLANFTYIQQIWLSCSLTYSFISTGQIFTQTMISCLPHVASWKSVEEFLKS